MKDFWNKFTTRFAVPLLIVTQMITLYDGWESRIEQKADRQQLIHCIKSHLHIVGEVHEVVDADGNKVDMPDEVPSVWYVRGSGFMPVSDHIKMIDRQKKIMCTSVNKVTTSRKKMGGNSYYVPVMSTLKYVDIKDSDQELIAKFFETKEAINNKVMSQWREQKEKKAKLGDLSDFGDVLNATG